MGVGQVHDVTFLSICNQSDALDLVIAEVGQLGNVVANFQAFQVALQHGPQNPIMVEDDDKEEAQLSKEEDEDEDPYVAPPIAVSAVGWLVLIEDFKEELEVGLVADTLAAEGAPPAYVEVNNN